jgi:hypothetical protein
MDGACNTHDRYWKYTILLTLLENEGNCHFKTLLMHDNIKMDLKYMGHKSVAWINLHQVGTSAKIILTR